MTGQAEARGSKSTSPSAEASVLLVEDDPSVSEVVAGILESRNYRVRVATKGRIALDMAIDDPPDIVILDLGLPDIDGVDDGFHNRFATIDVAQAGRTAVGLGNLRSGAAEVDVDDVGTAFAHDFCRRGHRRRIVGPELRRDGFLEAVLIDHLHRALLALELAAKAVEANQIKHEAELSAITGLAKPNNPTTLRAWFQTTGDDKLGIRMKDLRAETVESAMERMEKRGLTHRKEYRALELRSELAGTASKKFAAALYAVSSDGRIRGAFRYFGAHTGRWSGRGAQPQNLPRHTFGPDAEDLETLDLMKDLDVPKEEREAFEKEATDKVVARAVEGLELVGRLTPDELKRLVRACFTGPSWGDEDDLTVVDYSSIEARVIAWLAGEEWALRAFELGRDIYVETAERMGGLTRAQGKIAVLALGYAGGVNSLRNMAGPNDDFINDKSDDEIRNELVLPWRQANPAIVRFWATLEAAFAEGEGTAGLIRVTSSEDRLGRAVHLWLPSGRAISYHGVQWERYTVRDKKTGRRVNKEGWRYADPKAPFNRSLRIGTYGGRLAENVTQGAARDVMAEALVRLVRNGYRPVGHVHDEILTEGGDLANVTSIMTKKPRWAKGLPIDGEGFVTRRYKKG